MPAPVEVANMVWISQNGRAQRFGEIPTPHLDNILKKLRHTAEEAVRPAVQAAAALGTPAPSNYWMCFLPAIYWSLQAERQNRELA